MKKLMSCNNLGTKILIILLGLNFFILSLAFGDQAWLLEEDIGAEVSEDRVIVKLEDTYSIDAEHQILSAVDAKLLKRLKYTGILVLENNSDNISLEQMIDILSELDGVAYAEPDYRYYIDKTPNDARFPDLWGLHNVGQSGGTVDADIDAPEAWDITTGSSNIVVAVIDTGIDYNHPDLIGNMWVNADEIPDNGVDDDENGYVDDIYGIDPVNGDADPYDDHSHGTHCAGTIGATGNNGAGVVGVNWNVKIMALKFLDSNGSGNTTDAIECLEYAIMMKREKGVNLKLTSNSWGGGSYSQALHDAISISEAQGMLFVAAAGNDYGNNNDLFPHYPSNYDHASVVSVLSTDRYDALSSFSNYGSTSVDIGAPGSSILSTLPGGAYGTKSGTSMATPHVAGALALIWAQFPNYTAGEAKSKLMGSVDTLNSLSGKCVSQGRLNLFNALSGGGSNCLLDLTLGYAGSILSLDFIISTPETATFNIWISFLNQTIPLGSFPLPALLSPTPLSVPIPNFPQLGTIGVLTTINTRGGIVCSDWEVVDSGPVGMNVEESLDALAEIAPE